MYSLALQARLIESETGKRGDKEEPAMSDRVRIWYPFLNRFVNDRPVNVI
jgi:hypothetical protein